MQKIKKCPTHIHDISKVFNMKQLNSNKTAGKYYHAFKQIAKKKVVFVLEMIWKILLINLI
jgi:hypothetical protein